MALHSEAQILAWLASTQTEVEAAVRSFNALTPLFTVSWCSCPCPIHIDEEAVLNEVSLAKDVDGIHPLNLGRLGMRGRQPSFTPATPTGVMALINGTGQAIEGAQAVVVGRSNIVGLPVALMLMDANATVTICHSRTRDLPAVVKGADILVAAVGRAEFVKGDWLKPGAVVIDVGSNSVADADAEKGYRYVGDVEFAAAQALAGLYY